MAGGARFRIHSEDLSDQFLGQRFRGAALGDDAALVQHDETVRVSRGEFEIVKDTHHSPTVVDQGAQVIQESVLVMHIQVRSWFVQQQDPGVLRQSLGQENPPLLAAGEVEDGTILEAHQVYLVHGRFGRLPVGRVKRRQPLLVRGPAKEHQVEHVEVEGEGHRLGDHRHRSRALGGGPLRQVSFHQVDRPLVGRQAREGSKEGGLASTIWPDDAEPGTLLDLEIQRVKDRPTTEGHGQVFCRKTDHEAGTGAGPPCSGPMKWSWLIVLLVASAGCDSQQAAEEFEAQAALTPSGITTTDAQGIPGSIDEDDWRTSPLFLGKVRVDPAYPNPVTDGLATLPVSVLEFNGVQGGLVLRARNSSGSLVIVDEIPDASSPGGYVFQFAPAVLARTGIIRVFILDRIGNLISYGDLQVG